MSDVTRILSAIDAGDAAASAQLLPLVYDELRTLAAARMAREAPGQNLEATALVHEAYLRLVAGESPQQWNSRGHFFAAAAEAMRRILIDQARHNHSLRAGGDRQRVALSLVELEAPASPLDLLSLNDALEQLEGRDPRAAELVKLKFFAGLTIPEAAQVLSISVATAENDWAYARSWLKVQLSEEDSDRLPLPARKNVRN